MDVSRTKTKVEATTDEELGEWWRRWMQW
ncbi:hypothetical protein Gorai_022727, partial [Gossypium raimondii]|nr:hypothetical protein [Gossypium raimondii]